MMWNKTYLERHKRNSRKRDSELDQRTLRLELKLQLNLRKHPLDQQFNAAVREEPDRLVHLKILIVFGRRIVSNAELSLGELDVAPNGARFTSYNDWEIGPVQVSSHILDRYVLSYLHDFVSEWRIYRVDLQTGVTHIKVGIC
jgi:hypothetical protein